MLGPRSPQQVARMAAAVACSALGMVFHTAREFGYSDLWDPATGLIPVVGLQLLLFAWWLSPWATPAAAIALAATAILQLVGGAIISVLPLPILPFQPEQSIDHYLSHVVLGITQLPLLLVPRSGAASGAARRP